MEYSMNKYRNALEVKGVWDIHLVDRYGKVIDARENVINTVTYVGMAAIVTALVNETAFFPQTAGCFLAIGIGTTAAAASQTTLVTEVTVAGQITSYARVTGTKSIQAGANCNNVLQVVGTFAADNPNIGDTSTVAITEAGVFSDDGTPAGTMLNRVKFDAIAKGDQDSLQITMKITVGS